MARATTADIDRWSRNRLLGILASAAVVALVLLLGLTYAIYLAIHSAVTGQSPGEEPTLTSEQMHSRTALGEKHRNQVAATPMLTVDENAMRPATPTTELADTITIPEPATDTATGTATEAAGVPTGFPHTPEGAIGQLAALDQTVLTSMSVESAHEIYEAWAMPGGVGADDWTMTQNVTSFLGAAGMSSSIAPGSIVSVIPAAAQVKGTDGPDWTVACVLHQIDATASSSSSIGYGHCERMEWNDEPGAPGGGRWMIAPGPAPAPAPNTWPGSALALKAGWQTWSTGTTPDQVDEAAANAPDNNPGGNTPSGDGPGSNSDPN